MLAIGCVLDPRYKLKLIEYFYHIIYNDVDVAKKEYNIIHNGLYELLGEYQMKDLESVPSKQAHVGVNI